MPAFQLTNEELLKKLETNPWLRGRIESLLLAVEDESGELKEADAAELRLIEEMRNMGRESLQAWAQHRAQVSTEEALKVKGTKREGKKNSAGIRRLAIST